MITKILKPLILMMESHGIPSTLNQVFKIMFVAEESKMRIFYLETLQLQAFLQIKVSLSTIKKI